MSRLGGKVFSEDTDRDSVAGAVDAVIAGTNVTVDSSDPARPVVSASAAGGQVDSIVAGTNITSIDNTDPANPIINAATQAGDPSPLTTKGDVAGYDTGDARIPVGTNDQVLTADSTEALGVAWKDAAAGGDSLIVATNARFSPPLASDFPTWINQNGSVAEDDAYEGFLLSNMTYDPNSTRLIARLKTMPTGGFTATVKLTGAMRTESFNAFGLIVRDSTNDKSVVLRNVVSASEHRVSCTQYDGNVSDGDYGGGGASRDMNMDSINWYRIIDDTVNLIFQISHDGINFLTVGSETLASNYLALPDQIGIFIDPESFEGVWLACTYWDDKDTVATPALAFTGFKNDTPASAAATGTAGEMVWDTDYVYVCIATDTWKRTALTTW